MTLEHKILGQITVDSEAIAPDPKPLVAITENSDVAAYSTDGITWTETTLPTSQYWRSVTYGDGQYLAVGAGDGLFSNSTVAAYSTNGIIWTETTLPSASFPVYSVTYGSGKFVTLVYYDTKSFYSTDAITWTQSNMPTSTAWYSIVYGNDMFVATSTSGNTSITGYSTDAITWSQGTMPTGGRWYGITYGGGKFVAVSRDSTVAVYSTNGINWTQTTLPASVWWRSVAYGDGKFVAVASSGTTTAAYSTDAITWTQTTMPNSTSWWSVAYGVDSFVAVANTGGADEAAVSTDGITWNTVLLPSDPGWTSVNGGDPTYQVVSYTATQTVYTVPPNTETLVSSIFISNTSATTDTYNFAVVPSGETLSDIHQIRKNTNITAKDFHNIETKITMSAGDSLVALSGGSDKLNITVFGVEKS